MTEAGSDHKIHIRSSEETHRRTRNRCVEQDVTIQDHVARVNEDSLGVTAKKGLVRRKTGKRQ